MKRSRKIGVSILAVVVVGYVGLSWYVGEWSEKQTQRIVEDANQRIQTLLAGRNVEADVRIDSYDSGVFSSDAVYTVSIRGEDGQAKEFRLANHLDHGPLPWSRLRAGKLQPVMAVSHLEVEQTPATQRWFDAREDKNQSPLWADTVFETPHAGHSVWHFQPLHAQDGSLDFSGGTATAKLDEAFRASQFDAVFDHLAFSEQGDGVDMRDIHVTSKASRGDDDTRKMMVQATIAEVRQEVEDAGMAAKDWRMALSMEAAGERAHPVVKGDVDYRIGHLQMEQADLGSIALSGHVANLDLNALRELGDAYDRAEQAGRADSAELRALVKEKEIAFLELEPEVAVDAFEWKTPSGDSRLSAAAQLKVPDEGDGEDEALDWVAALKTFDLELDVSKPMLMAVILSGSGLPPEQGEGLIGMVIDMAAEPLMRAGFLREHDDHLMTSIHAKAGTVDLNGQQMPMDEFLNRATRLLMAGMP